MTMRLTAKAVLLSFFGAAGLGAASAALAQSPEEFYRGRQMEMVIGGGAGGGVDIYGRMVARHMVKYIPGVPSMIVRNYPAAGGTVGVSYLFHKAPRDGSAMGTMARGPVVEPLIGSRKLDYETPEFSWIGSASQDVSICGAWHTTSFKTIADAQAREMTVAGTGGSSETDTFPTILNDMLNTKFKLITGYSGTQQTLLAIERGEVDGRCGWGWSSLKSTNADWIRDRKIVVLLQLSMERHQDLKDVPTVMEKVTRQEDRMALELLLAPQDMARPFAAPPKVPTDRLAALRRAFDKTMTDSAFLADVDKIQGDISPLTGEKVQALVTNMYKASPQVIERVKTLIAPR